MSRTRTPVTVVALALACALTGALMSAGPALAASRGYKIYNLSSHALRLINATPGPPSSDMDFEGRPIDGDVLKPGAPPHDWELKYGPAYEANLHYDVVGTGLKYEANLMTNLYTNNSYCSIDSSLGACSAEGLTLTVTDPPGTKFDIPSGRAQEQAETLRDLCAKDNAATCTFTPTSRTPSLTQAHIVGRPLTNCGEDENRKTISVTDKVVQSNSVETAVGFKIGFDFIEKAEASIEFKYGYKWSNEHEFKDDVDLKVKPGHIGWIVDTAPILRDRGDFKLTLANTTWNLRDVYFDTPDPDRKTTDPTKVGGFTTHDRELSPEEYKAQCSDGASRALQRAPAYLVPMKWKGTGRPDTLLAGHESHTVQGLAGNDVIRGGRGHDALNGGRHDDVLDGDPGRDTLEGRRGSDMLDGGRGRDTLDGGPGADTMIDNRGPTLVETGPNTGPGTDTVEVRDGRGDDTVICGSRSSTVIVDAGDSVIGRCGKVSRSGRN